MNFCINDLYRVSYNNGEEHFVVVARLKNTSDRNIYFDDIEVEKTSGQNEIILGWSLELDRLDGYTIDHLPKEKYPECYL